MYQTGSQHCRLMILVSSYQSNNFGIQLADGMDGALQICQHQQHVRLPVDLVYIIVQIIRKKISYL